MAKAQIVHKDILGQDLIEGNYVAASHHNSMYICRVIKITPKQIRIVNVKSNSRLDTGWLKYSSETVKLSGEDAMAFILTYA